jgi:hypothetical protein
MTERTVTEKQVIAAINKHISKNKNDSYHVIFDELFPELPAHNELVKVWNDEKEPIANVLWRPFKEMSSNGRAITYFSQGSMGVEWENYRRQTPAERGEG